MCGRKLSGLLLRRQYKQSCQICDIKKDEIELGVSPQKEAFWNKELLSSSKQYLNAENGVFKHLVK